MSFNQSHHDSLIRNVNRPVPSIVTRTRDIEAIGTYTMDEQITPDVPTEMNDPEVFLTAEAQRASLWDRVHTKQLERIDIDEDYGASAASHLGAETRIMRLAQARFEAMVSYAYHVEQIPEEQIAEATGVTPEEVFHIAETQAHIPHVMRSRNIRAARYPEEF